jgi:molybdopterin molybdotransferase
LLSTGDELLLVGSPWEKGKIYDSNSFTLENLIKKSGGECVKLDFSVDAIDSLGISLDKAIKGGIDLIVSSGGVSMGAHDYVRTIIEQEGEIKFWRINMSPGKPLAFGSYHSIPFIRLPGNPVSAFIGFIVFVKPVLDRLSGLIKCGSISFPVYLTEQIESDGRESYLRAYNNQQDGRWEAKLTRHQGSGNLMSLVRANALIIIPSGVKFLPVGAEVEA